MTQQFKIGEKIKLGSVPPFSNLTKDKFYDIVSIYINTYDEVILTIINDIGGSWNIRGGELKFIPDSSLLISKRENQYNEYLFLDK